MTEKFDIIIRGGTVIDGTGGKPRHCDVAVRGDRIVAIAEQINAEANDVIDASGAIVTPGFIDVHTHYDGQFIWDTTLEPSFSHGVTTVVAGNCGVGFAPVRAEHRQKLVELMEGVEEIPGIVLDEGLDWKWTSFPDYLDRLESQNYSLNIAAQIPHAPLRVFVMGERALRHEPATPEDISEMARLVQEGMEAGAVGVSGARILEHMSSTGEAVPGTFAEDEEMIALARAMGSTGRGTFQLVPLGLIGDLLRPAADSAARMREHDRIVQLAAASGRPVTYLIEQFDSDVDDWRTMVAQTEKAVADGLQIHPQCGARGIGMTSMLDGYHAFLLRPSYMKIADLPLAERAAAMRDPATRRAILSEVDAPPSPPYKPRLAVMMARFPYGSLYPVSLPLDYEPVPEQRIDALAAQLGISPQEFLYDHYANGDGSNVAMSFGLNYSEHNLHAVREMLTHPAFISGLGDGGAHIWMVCDASLPTFHLTFWGRDRERGERLPVPFLVRKLTSEAADLYGLHDRGRLEENRIADINVIDFDRLSLGLPYVARDLPLGSPRVLQKADGYRATIVAGTVTRRNDQDTGARPGKLLRGGR
jgi:N-acyl-D-amino-acid deacylase